MFDAKKSGQLFSAFDSMKVLVIGDVMVDSYIWGRVERISPEAPVPVVSVTRREDRLGGAANVALNILSLGAKPIMCTLTGNDHKGDLFMQMMDKKGLTSMGVMRNDKRITTTKFRIIGNNYQMLRVDEEIDSELPEEISRKFAQMIIGLIDTEKPNVIIFEDYDKGIITPLLINLVVSKAMKNNIPVAVDPKKRNFQHYIDVNLFKPNVKELKEGLKLDVLPTDFNALCRITASLQAKLNIEVLLLTMSESGIFVSVREKPHKYNAEIIPAIVRNVADVSGAGDTVISTAALCMAAGLTPHETAYISNVAGGLVCEEVGVVPVDRAKLIRELSQ